MIIRLVESVIRGHWDEKKDRGPFVLNIIASQLFNNSNGVLSNQILMNHTVELSREHGLDKMYAVRHDDAISVDSSRAVHFLDGKELDGVRGVE